MVKASNDLVTGRKMTTRTTGSNVGKGSRKCYEVEECSKPANKATEASSPWIISKLIELMYLLKLRQL